MDISQIEANLKRIGKHISKETFIYDLLLAYGLPKASITRLKSGNLNLSKNEGEVLWKKKLFFKPELDADIHETIDAITSGSQPVKHEPRFIIVTDWETLLAADNRTNDKLDIPLKEIAKYYDFFLPWAGLEKTQHQGENPADVKAAERMAKLFNEIKKDNPKNTPEYIHSLNVFLSRLLFCFFADDTGIFGKNQFVNAVGSHTQADGNDLTEYLDILFEVLNTENKKRKKLPAYLEAFPYVNGSLFKGGHKVPKFTRRSRQAILDCGELDWSAINPDIFGSMIQAVVRGHEEDDNTKHYTSVPNIMKVIEPLFLNELCEEFEAAKGSKNKLKALLHRIQKIKIFDPACGSGNFLIIVYKELRKLEMKILKAGNMLELSGISLSNFYGIELDDFAHEIAMLSLWLAEHQMHMAFFKEFGKTNATLPLKKAGDIVHGNATRLDWKKVCPPKNGDEIYILGNPPYLGGKGQSKEQKQDMAIVFEGIKNFKELDYIACWFYIASKYISSNHKFAFVTTSSINQGAQVEQLWPLVFRNDVEIYFAFKPFVWTNNARSKAGVACSIIGLQKRQDGSKYIFDGKTKHQVNNINSHLTSGREKIISKRLNPISKLPSVITGNSPYDNGNLMLSKVEMDEITNAYPEAVVLFKRLNGADELLNGIERYCLWIKSELLALALSIPPIKHRIERTKKFRETGGDVARGIANRPHQFRYTHSATGSQIVIPIVSSERREYIPIGFLPKEYIVISSAAAIYDCEPYIFGIVSSKMHIAWVKLTAGRLENRLRYLSALCYNTFPFPSISNNKKTEITQHVFRILEERENHSQKTLAELYDPDKMPKALRDAHYQLDLMIESCYRSKLFSSDEERLEYLFNLYETMLAEDADKDGLFAMPEKTARRKK